MFTYLKEEGRSFSLTILTVGLACAVGKLLISFLPRRPEVKLSDPRKVEKTPEAAETNADSLYLGNPPLDNPDELNKLAPEMKQDALFSETLPPTDALYFKNSAFTNDKQASIASSDNEVLLPEASASDIEMLSPEASASDIEVLSPEASASDIEVSTVEASASDIEVLTAEASASDIEVLTAEASASDIEVLTTEASASDQGVSAEASASDQGVSAEASASDQEVSAEASASDQEVSAEASASDQELPLMETYKLDQVVLCTRISALNQETKLLEASVLDQEITPTIESTMDQVAEPMVSLKFNQEAEPTNSAPCQESLPTEASAPSSDMLVEGQESIPSESEFLYSTHNVISSEGSASKQRELSLEVHSVTNVAEIPLESLNTIASSSLTPGIASENILFCEETENNSKDSDNHIIPNCTVDDVSRLESSLSELSSKNINISICRTEETMLHSVGGEIKIILADKLAEEALDVKLASINSLKLPIEAIPLEMIYNTLPLTMRGS